MNISEIVAALGLFIVIATAVTAMIKILVEVTVAHEVEALLKNSTSIDTKVSKRLNRIERRIAGLEVRIFGETDTFGDSE